MELIVSEQGFPTPLAPQHLQQHLDGSLGENRSNQHCQINANNDIEAIHCFLNEYKDSPATHRSYEKEAERLLLWAWINKNKPLSSLNRQDFEDYFHFLQDPQPKELWCGKRAKRHSPEWKPFAGPLSANAQVSAIAAINSMMKYLVDAGYLTANPLGLIRLRNKKVQREVMPDLKVERFLDEEMWQAVIEVIDAMPQETEKEKNQYERMRFIMTLLYMMAPRAGELESHTMNSFREVRGKWWWYVLGKGAKAARVPVPSDMLIALQRYRSHLGLTPFPAPDDTLPLLLSVKGNKGISARRLNQMLKEIFQQAALILETYAPHKAQKLRKASAHWGRHTSITAKIDSGIDKRYVQKNARHSDSRTTELYIHTEEEVWHEESEKHKLGWGE